MLFAVPPVLIIAAWLRGCRPEERVIVASISLATAALLVPALVWTAVDTSKVAGGIAYALVTVSTASTAMLLRRRPGRGGGGGGDDGGEPRSPTPPPFDWDDFERAFREHVRARERNRARPPGGVPRTPA